jgi:hypothetical protein
MRLEVPGFIKEGVMALFHNTCGEVEIQNILIQSRVPKEDTREIVLVKFPTAVATSFHTHLRPKHFQGGQVWLGTIVTLKWRDTHSMMDKTVVEVDQV